MMNDQQLIDYMKAFIKDKEKGLQEADLLKDNKAKNDLINDVLKELEVQFSDENK